MPEPDWKQILDAAVGDFSLAALPPAIVLPALPIAVTRFLDEANKPNPDLKILAGILETDTGLTVELLRYINSGFVGLRNKAKSALQALSLLGLRQSKMFVTTTGMKSAMQSRKSKLIHPQTFWNGTLQKALFAREAAALLRADVDLAFAGAVLQDFLIPVLTNELSDQYVSFLESSEKTGQTLSEFEQMTFGWDHALAAACLAKAWKLPDDLACCVLYHHQGLHLLGHPEMGRSAAAAVALSALLPDQLHQTNDGLRHLLMVQDRCKAFRLEEIAERVDANQAEINMGVRNEFPLAKLFAKAIAQRAAAGASPVATPCGT